MKRDGAATAEQQKSRTKLLTSQKLHENSEDIGMDERQDGSSLDRTTSPESLPSPVVLLSTTESRRAIAPRSTRSRQKKLTPTTIAHTEPSQFHIALEDGDSSQPPSTATSGPSAESLMLYPNVAQAFRRFYVKFKDPQVDNLLTEGLNEKELEQLYSITGMEPPTSSKAIQKETLTQEPRRTKRVRQPSTRNLGPKRKK